MDQKSFWCVWYGDWAICGIQLATNWEIMRPVSKSSIAPPLKCTNKSIQQYYASYGQWGEFVTGNKAHLVGHQ